MKLTDILISEACVVDMQAKTKKEALRELAAGLAASVEGLEAPELLDMLLEREKLGTTAMGDGIAIPHARVESLDRLLSACDEIAAGFRNLEPAVRALFESPAVGVDQEPAIGALLDRTREHANRRPEQSFWGLFSKQIGQKASRNFRVSARLVVERQPEESIGREGCRAGERASKGLLGGAVSTQRLEEMAPEIVEPER